jgi:hypothetical protein
LAHGELPVHAMDAAVGRPAGAARCHPRHEPGAGHRWHAEAERPGADRAQEHVQAAEALAGAAGVEPDALPVGEAAIAALDALSPQAPADRGMRTAGQLAQAGPGAGPGAQLLDDAVPAQAVGTARPRGVALEEGDRDGLERGGVVALVAVLRWRIDGC